MENKKYLSIRRQPANISSQHHHLFEQELQREIHGSDFERLGRAWLVTDTIFKPSQLRVRDDLTHPLPLSKLAKLKRIFHFYPKARRIEKTLWISDHWSHNYFHWMTEALTRLISLKGEFSDHTIVLPEQLRPFSYIQESLKYFDYPVTYLQKEEVIFTNDLISFERVAPSFNYHSTPLNKLREHFRKNSSDSPPSRKIYISRKKTAKRRITNEDMVEKVAMKHGFEIHFFENYNFDQQLRLMLDCSVLMSIHGAGLTNMIYMKEGSSVIEFRFAEDGINNCYFVMASDLAHDYYYTQDQFETPKLHLNSNMIVDIDGLEKVLQSLDNKNEKPDNKKDS